MDRFDPFVKYSDIYGDVINWEKDPMNKPQNQNKYFFSDGKTYYEQICKMLKLMSVFKEAFNQIYSNEDEISEAWENFVNNLSASVVEGSEPDVTLTWTDDSVNFEFTMVPGVPGEQGVGITSISFNSDYTMTITLSDGNTYTSMSLKGETGPQGPQGETGSGLQILDVYATLADLQSAHPTGQPGDAYQVGSTGSYTLYIWSSSQSTWVPAGSLGTVSPSVSNPLMDGTASAGSLGQYSRGDHVHPSDTSRASKEELDALVKTSQALIDQSFTYRESPAIQDGLARIDKIKGNTLVWNQLVQNGNFADTNSWDKYNCTLSVSNNVATITATATSGNIYTLTSLRFALSNGDKVLVCGKIRAGTDTARLRFNIGGAINVTENATTTWQTVANIVTAGSSGTGYAEMFALNNGTAEYKDVMVFNLTKMGLGSITDPSEFFSLFPLTYYSYDAGSLLSFNGSGLKITGKNLFTGAESYTRESAGYYIREGETNNPLPLKLAKGTYTISIKSTVGGTSQLELFSGGTASSDRIIGTYVSLVVGVKTYTFTIDKPCDYIRLYGNFVGTISDIQIESGSTATSYEPYTESTLSLPVSTYFPTGMKSAKTIYDEAYDELTHSKAITRMGIVDLGSLTWTYTDVEGHLRFVSSTITPNAKSLSLIANVVCAKYEAVTEGNVFNNQKVGICIISNSRAMVYDPNYTDATAFKTAMSGVYLYYELETPTETSIDLDLDFMAYENGTEQLLPVNGSVPSTSPIIADMTYLSIDDAMEYVLEKLANVPQNTQHILESLEDDVADLQADVGALQPAVSGLQTSVGNINTNIGQLSSTVAGHTASISDMKSDITDLNTGLSDLEDTVTDNTSRIGTLETGLATTNGNVQSLSSQVQSIDGRVTNLESDLFKVVVKEFDYDSITSKSNFGITTPITQEEGYRVIGVVGTEAQAGEYTSPASNIAITQCHIYYTSLGALTITIFGRNNGPKALTNVRIYAYLLCIKDIQ